MRDGVPIFSHYSIDPAVVDAEAKGAVLFVAKEYRGAPWGRRGLNEAFLEHIVQVLLDSLELDFGHVVNAV